MPNIAKQALIEFIEGIPDDKLMGFPDAQDTIFKDIDFRLDMQGKTSGKPQCYNLQVQVNNSTRISTLKREKRKSIAGPVLLEVQSEWSPQEIRDKLLAKLRI